MVDITILPANLATLVLESFLYGLLLLLFLSTVYFLATQRTLAGTTHSARHHFTSLVFMGATALFLVVTAKHWSVVIYQASLAFIHLGTAATEAAFYGDLAQRSEVVKLILVFIATMLGDALVTYRLWIIWARHRLVVVFPIMALLGLAAACIGIVVELAKWDPKLGRSFRKEAKPMEVITFVLSLLANLYSTGCIIFRICMVTKAKSASESRLTWFLSILVESAALQTFWLTFLAITGFLGSDMEFIALDNFPVILAISNTLIQARVGLGWSQDSAVARRPRDQATTKSPVTETQGYV
ncbi:hypothetical protein B0H13DRAFT_2652272 [Mycena leptocephala]|nr:hypothetical protein B0H13DRAFT_2652272 [Mycena leptocephala]